MENAKLKVLFRIPWTVYWLATATYGVKPCTKKFFCLATKEFDPDDGNYYYMEISGKADIDCEITDESIGNVF